MILTCSICNLFFVILKELARRLMEEEKREYKKSRDKEKRRAEVEYKVINIARRPKLAMWNKGFV